MLKLREPFGAAQVADNGTVDLAVTPSPKRARVDPLRMACLTRYNSRIECLAAYGGRKRDGSSGYRRAVPLSNKRPSRNVPVQLYPPCRREGRTAGIDGDRRAQNVKRGVTGSDRCGCNSCGKGRRTEDEAETGSGEAGTDFSDGDSSDDHGGLTPDTINRANCCTNPKTK